MPSAIVGALILAASPSAHADLRIALGNDAFSEVKPPLDDSGFTNDLELTFWRPVGSHVFGVKLFDRWLTEVGGARRQDLVELLATAAHTWGQRRTLAATLSGRAGPVTTGNFGGRWMQNGWHSLSHTGPTLDQGLQHLYITDHQFGAVAGARAGFSIGEARLQTYGWVDGQLALGTGVSSFEIAYGAQPVWRVGGTEIAMHVELALARFGVADDALTLPGGYGVDRWQTCWRVGAHVAWSRYRVEYQYRANEGGSGEPIGIWAFTIKQAGTRVGR
jgi:hypothetical protein